MNIQAGKSGLICLFEMKYGTSPKQYHEVPAETSNLNMGNNEYVHILHTFYTYNENAILIIARLIVLILYTPVAQNLQNFAKTEIPLNIFSYFSLFIADLLLNDIIRNHKHSNQCHETSSRAIVYRARADYIFYSTL